jgi:Tol biopolymer transport system component
VYTLYSSRKPLEFANHGAEPSWSPDGRWLVYSDYTECCDTSLYRLELATGDVEQLTDMEGSEFYPTWSPDGERIAFVWGGAFRTSYLYIMGADGSNPYEVLPGLTSVIRPQWSPDGERILFHSFCPEYALLTLGERECIRADYDVYSLRLADGHIQRMAVTRLPIDEYNPVWSPDGEWVVYATFEKILMAHPDGSDVQELTEQRQIHLDYPTWVKTPNYAWRPIILLMTGLVCVMIGARKPS